MSSAISLLSLPKFPSRSLAEFLPETRITASWTSLAPTFSYRFGKTIISPSPNLSSIPTNAIFEPLFVTIVRTVLIIPPTVIIRLSYSGTNCVNGWVCSLKYVSYLSSGCAEIYNPNNSRSHIRRSLSSCFTGAFWRWRVDWTLTASSPPNIPNKLVCPLAASFWSLDANDVIESRLKSKSDRSPISSNAPDLISDSQAFLLNLLVETRLAKSSTDVNGPSSRARRTSSTAPTPTPFTADIPKRILFSFGTTANSTNDSFTSGLSTLIPMCLHSVISIAKRSVSSWSLVISAAINASG